MKCITNSAVSFLLLCMATLAFAQQKTSGNATINTKFTPGEVWNDTNGNPINAHGGGILFYNGTYYWYGELKKGSTTKVPDASWENYRVIANGVSCYSSRDLLNWTYEGVAMASEKTDTSSDIYEGKVIERPKVIYNKKTKQFVMWMHIDSKDYAAAKSGVAISDKPQGPFRYLHSERPNGEMARDMTIFQDDDGKAYHFFSSENNGTMRITQLSDDYLSHTNHTKRILIDRSREAPAVFKYNKRYYLITSGCTGWDPNQASYSVADSIMGEWKEYDNPCKGTDADKTFYAQSTYVIPIDTKNGKYIFMADKWNKTDLENSRYIWLPLEMKDGVPAINWMNNWTMSDLKK